MLQAKHGYHDLHLTPDDFLQEDVNERSKLQWHLLEYLHRSTTRSTSASRHRPSTPPPVAQVQVTQPSPKKLIKEKSPAIKKTKVIATPEKSPLSSKSLRSSSIHSTPSVEAKVAKPRRRRRRIRFIDGTKSVVLEDSRPPFHVGAFSPASVPAKYVIPTRSYSRPAPAPVINNDRFISSASSTKVEEYEKYEKRRQRLISLGLQKTRKSFENQNKQLWIPPSLTSTNAPAGSILPLVTEMTILSIRKWLQELGLPLKDGDGGYVPLNDGLAPPQPRQQSKPLSVLDDSIRNGRIFYELLLIFERNIAVQANMPTLMIHHPRTIPQILENLERIFWLFKLCKSPPIPSALLTQPKAIVEGNKQVIWSLLYEIMQAYRVPATLQAVECPQVHAIEKREGSYRQLTYDSTQRRLLDLSLLQWLSDLGILSKLLGRYTPSLSIAHDEPPISATSISSILSLEGPLRDGTLLCELVISHLHANSSIQRFNQHPKSFQQCLANVALAVSSLRNVPGMSHRFLYTGVDEEIVRGHWDGIIGLLEDMHRCYDGVLTPDAAGMASLPYLKKPKLSPKIREEPVPPPVEPEPETDEVAREDEMMSSSQLMNILSSPKNFGSQLNVIPAVDSEVDEFDARSYAASSLIASHTFPSVTYDSVGTGAGTYDESVSATSSSPQSHDSLMQGPIAKSNLNFHRSKKLEKIQKLASRLGCSLFAGNQQEIMTSSVKNGVDLCQFIMKLERNSSFPGVTWAPKTYAQRLQNIRKFLDIVQKKLKTTRVDVDTLEEDILGGTERGLNSLVDLLDKIRLAYGHFS